MIARILAMFVVLVLVGGAAQPPALQAASSVAVELEDTVGEAVLPVEPLGVVVAPHRRAIMIEMPVATTLAPTMFAARMFRPPRV